MRKDFIKKVFENEIKELRKSTLAERKAIFLRLRRQGVDFLTITHIFEVSGHDIEKFVDSVMRKRRTKRR